MNIEEAREYCLSLKNVTECFPFDDVSLVFKVEQDVCPFASGWRGTVFGSEM